MPRRHPWVYLLTVFRDDLASERWDIYVARGSKQTFAWKTSGSGGLIDMGSAELIADYLLENASGFERELRQRIIELANHDPKFQPLLIAVEDLYLESDRARVPTGGNEYTA